MQFINQLIAMKDGGAWMIPILVVAVFAMAVAFERLFYILFRANINSTAFMAQVQKLIMANNIDRAIKLCNAEPHAALPRVIKAGLTRANRTEKEIENAIDEATLEVGPRVNKRTPYLNVSEYRDLMWPVGYHLGFDYGFPGCCGYNRPYGEANSSGRWYLYGYVHHCWWFDGRDSNVGYPLRRAQ